MSMAGRTKKPCEGCGAEGSRKKGQVCRACQTLLSQAAAVRDAQAQGEYTELRWVMVTELPYPKHGGRRQSHGFGESVARLAVAVSVPDAQDSRGGAYVTPKYPPQIGRGSISPYSYDIEDGGLRWFRADDLALLEQLWEEAVEEVDHGVEAAWREGLRWLDRLASGDVSIERMNALAIEQGTRVR